MRADFDPQKKEWFIESPLALSSIHRVRVVKYLKDMYAMRIKGEIGDKKRRMQSAVDQLTPNNLVVRLVGKGDKTLYVDPNEKL